MTPCTRPLRLLVATSTAALLISILPTAFAQTSIDDKDIVVTGTLTAPDTQQATIEIQRAAGGVEVVPETAFKNSPAQNSYTPLNFRVGYDAGSGWSVYLDGRYCRHGHAGLRAVQSGDLPLDPRQPAVHVVGSHD